MTASTRLTPPKLPRPQRAPLATSPTLAAMHQRLLERPQLASQLQAQLWQQVTSTPLLEADPTQEGKYLVTFLWRGAAHSVLLFVNRLTDEKNLADSYMQRLPGTDTWYLTYRMDGDWRASYCFLPAPAAAQAPWLQGSQVRLRQALDGGLPDPGNPVTCTNRRGFVQSVVSLPLAPAWPLGEWPVFSDDAAGAGRFDGGGLGAGRGDDDAGRLDDAIPLFEQNLTDFIRILGPDRPDTFTSRSTLAGAYQAAGRLNDAIPLFEQNLEDRTRTLGPHHPHTLISRDNLASAYRAAGRIEDAEKLFGTP